MNTTANTTGQIYPNVTAPKPATAPTTTTDNLGSTAEHLKSAGEHLQDAARKAVNTIPSVNAAATKVLKDGYAEIVPDLAAAKREAADAGSAVVAEGEKKWHAMVDQGKSALERSEQFVRERPLASIGMAIAGGFLLSRLIRN